MKPKPHRMLLVAIVLACSVEANAQKVNGWERLTPEHDAFKRDHTACMKAHPLERSLGNPNGFTNCMRAKGWVKGTP